MEEKAMHRKMDRVGQFKACAVPCGDMFLVRGVASALQFLLSFFPADLVFSRPHIVIPDYDALTSKDMPGSDSRSERPDMTALQSSKSRR